MTSSNRNIFRVTGPLCGEFNGHLWFPFTKAMQWRETLMFSLICARTSGSVNNRNAGDLRRHRANYDVTVMVWDQGWIKIKTCIPHLTQLFVQQHRNHQHLTILDLREEVHRWPMHSQWIRLTKVNPIMWKTFPCDDVIVVRLAHKTKSNWCYRGL